MSPKTLVSGGLKLSKSAAAKKEFVGAALTGILADVCAEPHNTPIIVLISFAVAIFAGC
jgi:hypothetical protein